MLSIGNQSLYFLLGPDLVGVATLSLSAVGSFSWESGITESANRFLNFEFSCKSSEWGFDLDGSWTSTSQSEHQMKSWLFLDVVVGKSSAVFKLLSSEDQSLLIRGNTLFVLDFGSNIIHKTYFTLSIVSDASTSNVIVLPVRVFTKIYILIL